MKRFFTILSFLLFFSIGISAQENATDSLLNLIKNNPHDSLKAEYYYQLGGTYNYEESLEAKLNAHLIAAKLFNELPLSRHKIRNLSSLGYCYMSKKDYRNADRFFKLAIQKAQKENDIDLEFLATEHYLEAFLNLRSPVKGLEIVFDLKNKAIEHERKDLLFKCYELKNKHYLISGVKFEERKTTADTMLIIAQELNDSLLLQRAYFHLGATTMNEASIRHYKESLNYTDRDNLFAMSSVYNNLSGRFRFIGKLDEALNYADSALQVSIASGRKEGVAAAYYRMAEAYFFKEDYEQVIVYGNKALKEFQNANILRRQNNCAEAISAAYEEMGNFKKALEYYELKVALTDSLDGLNDMQEIEFVEQRLLYEMAQKRDSTDIALKTLKLENATADLEKQKMKQYLLYGGIGMFLILVVVLTIGFQRKKRANLLIQEQKKLVEEKNKEITDSIQYAKRIQSAILPPDKLVQEYLQQSFILYKPKDIVAGDFYWMESVFGQGKNDLQKVLFAAADCTGHGVPGAMVSVVCNNGLNRSVREHGLTDPGEILDKTREIVVAEFHAGRQAGEKSEEEVKDGMDIALCSLQGNTLEYAGAHNPLWIIRKGATEVEEIKANKQPIGKFDNAEPYTTHKVELAEGDSIYIFSDGYADQFGGEKGKKLKTVNFKKLLLSIQQENMEKQKELIDEAFEKWKGDLEQLDDVCVIGVRM